MVTYEVPVWRVLRGNDTARRAGFERPGRFAPVGEQDC